MKMNCGLKEIRVWDAAQTAEIFVPVLYPSSSSETCLHFGPYTIDAAINGELAGKNLSLVLVSHGNGSTPWAFRDLAKSLALNGFVVALIEHPGNNRNDNALAQSLANLENRPRHLSLVIDALFSDALLAPAIKKSHVGVIGHSIGAYTALTAAGARPWAGPHETRDGKPAEVFAKSDSRISALALLMPASFWFPEGSLRNVNIPILIRTGTNDRITPSSPHADTIIFGVAPGTRVEHTSIAGAGHHSVQSIYPAELTSPDFPPSQDPPGFDRASYQPKLFADINGFFKQTLVSMDHGLREEDL